MHGRLGSSGRTLTHEGPFASLTRDWVGRSEIVTDIEMKFLFRSILNVHDHQGLLDLDEGFGNFLNCTRRKESFETESALEPGIFRTNA